MHVAGQNSQHACSRLVTQKAWKPEGQYDSQIFTKSSIMGASIFVCDMFVSLETDALQKKSINMVFYKKNLYYILYHNTQFFEAYSLMVACFAAATIN